MGEAMAGGSKDPRLCRVHSPWLAGAGTRDKGCSGLIPWASLNNDTLYSGSCFLHKLPVYRPPPSLPSPQDVSSERTTVLCLGLLSKPHISGPSPCVQWWTPSQAWGAGLWLVPSVEVSLCPAATHCFPCSLPTENEALLLSKLSSPSEGLPWIW